MTFQLHIFCEFHQVYAKFNTMITRFGFQFSLIESQLHIINIDSNFCYLFMRSPTKNITTQPKKRRGRPPKNATKPLSPTKPKILVEIDVSSDSGYHNMPAKKKVVVEKTKPIKRRGRPPKKLTVAEKKQIKLPKRISKTPKLQDSPEKPATKPRYSIGRPILSINRQPEIKSSHRPSSNKSSSRKSSPSMPPKVKTVAVDASIVIPQADRYIPQVGRDQILQIVSHKREFGKMLYLVRWKSVRGKIPDNTYVGSEELQKHDYDHLVSYNQSVWFRRIFKDL